MLKKITSIVTRNKPVLIIYTDGSCIGNGKSNSKGGVGVFYSKDSNRNISLSYNDVVSNLGFASLGYPTNNKTELLAVLLALKSNELSLIDNHSIIIKTDSKYVIDSLTKWYHSWIKNDWMNSSNKPVLNREIIEKIIIFILKYKNQITFQHVRAHTSSPSVDSKEYPDWYGNDMADKLATLASNKGSLLKETVNKYIKEGW
jgi:ribonuclease HI